MSEMESEVDFPTSSRHGIILNDFVLLIRDVAERADDLHVPSLELKKMAECDGMFPEGVECINALVHR